MDSLYSSYSYYNRFECEKNLKCFELKLKDIGYLRKIGVLRILINQIKINNSLFIVLMRIK